ncbi:MAG: major capsid protein [Pseudomonadota bacterium]
MPVDYFDPRVLVGVINRMAPQYDLITSLFFNHQAPSNVELFELHIKTEDQTLAPVVNKYEGGRIVEVGNGTVVQVKAPRFRMKVPYQAADMIKNGVGYTPYEQEANPIERKIAEDLLELRRRVDNSIEYMTSQIVTTGKVKLVDKVDGKNVTMYELDNRMPSNHKVSLTGNALWSASTSSILNNVEDWVLRIEESSGQTPTDLVVGKNVWSNFLRHVDVKDNYDNRRIDFGSLTPRVQNKFKGTWNGLNVWTYAGKVKDNTNTPVSYLDPNSILLGSNSADTVIEHARPLDLVCTGPTQFFAKTFDQDDPSGTFLVVEARPLPWARRPETFLCAKVL